jgi:soluble lytic murein transglycosylase-like protein
LLTKQIVLTLSTIILLGLPNVAHAATSITKAEILELIKHAEQENHIPSGLLLAVVTVESKLQPFALNIAGRSLFFKNKDTALQAIKQALSKNITNIDIGIAQVNYKWHQHNFTSLEDMISPEVNIKYAAELLAKLKQDYGDWHTAVRHYHSSNPQHHRKYSRKIVMCWLESH